MTSNSFKPVAEQLAYLKKGAAEIIPEPELRASLEKSLKSGTPLRVYLGVDPTAPDLHLGHTVVLRKLKHFQDMGHTAVFLIGDFSAMIGDPTGVSETRPPLTREQVDANAKTYLAQVFKILDPAKTEVRYNSEWLSKLSAEAIVRLCSHYRLARMLEREDFRKRLDEGQPISVHELLYPLLTAYDAVSLKSDVELGATEQKFNLLVHREIQREYGLPGQAILTMPILVGLDGQRKMSKSLGNYIGITEPPADMFGKIMSIPDDLMWTYYELVTDRTPQQITGLKQEVSSGSLHPMDAKMRLAEEIVSGFHGPDPARKAAENFQRVFRDREIPDEMEEFTVTCTRVPEGWHVTWVDLSVVVWSEKSATHPKAIKWTRALAGIKQVVSVAEAERIVKQKGFEVNGQLVIDPSAKLDLTVPAAYKIRVGKKKFLRIVVE
ncbi:MAG TPA: tyrosine--tRNA ligase [Candidatus Acidoferrum sp.]|nr:tyrosine--tRNA ligase [Candidatus Acidoferrum sp.]